MIHAAWLRALLWPVSWIFEVLVRLRTRLYRMGIFKSRRFNSSVISVGNLTLGGTGKTPMVLWIAERLVAAGGRVGILTRGYRGSQPEEGHARPVSDEVLVLRNRLGGKVKFGVGPDRYALGQALEQQGIDWFILDDGFQHLRLARDVNILLLDATDPFGHGHLLPAGRLREPKSALARADIVVITRSDHAPAVEAIVARHTHARIFYAQTELEGVFEVGKAEAVGKMADWRERRFFAFCGIGNPAAFFEDLHRWGMRIAGQAAFRDHHRYTSGDAQRLEHQAQAVGADALICTEKDLFNLARASFQALPVLYCRISLRVAEAEGFWKVVLATVERNRPGVAA